MQLIGKTVYVLGAGASIGHTKGKFPSINDFFKKAKEYHLISDTTKRVKKQYEELHKYIIENFGVNILDKSEDIDIELILNTIEIELERSSNPILLNIKNQILSIIKSVLYKIQNIVGGEYYIFPGYIKPNDSIFTFNWDLLLDDILGRENVLSKEYREGMYYHGFYKKYTAPPEYYFENMGYNYPYNVWDKNSQFYLKLHGSIDWIFCDNELCRANNKIFPILNPLDLYYCSYCHEEMKLLIVPPILNKQYRTYPLIRQIWSTAVREIQSIENLAIWGYSLPPTDFYSKWLLSKARYAKLKKLIIINPFVSKNVKGGEAVRYEFVRNFYDMYRDILPKREVYLYKAFKDFENNNDLFKIIGKEKKFEKVL